MSALLMIWWATVVMAVVSVIAMTGLIIQRAWRNRRLRTDNARRQELRSFALRLIQCPAQLAELEQKLLPKDRRLLLQVYNELLPKIRGDYADRLVSLMRELGLMEDCLEQSRDPDWLVRAQACQALGAFPDPDATLALYRAAEDCEPAVRVEAARALVRQGTVRSVVELVRQVAPGDDLPSVTVMALFRSLGRDAVPQLIALLESNKTGLAARLVAADALGHIGDLRAVPALLQLYDQPSVLVRMTSMEALARLGDPRALPAVLLSMTDSAWEVRAQAASAAGRIGSRETEALLRQLLEDEYWWVRYYAAEALFRMGEVGRSALKRAARGPNPLAAEMASGVLEEKGLPACS
jgi:HEAT repeat protein